MKFRKISVGLTLLLCITFMYTCMYQVKAENFSPPVAQSNELEKYQLSGLHKKDWSQRLQWFESKIISYYKNLNVSDVVVVGEQKFLDTFQNATKEHGWNANFMYCENASVALKQIKPNCLVIDTLYKPIYLTKIYGNINVSVFKDVYQEILYDEALTFFKNNGVEYYFFEGPIWDKIKNKDAYERNPKFNFKNYLKNPGFTNAFFAGNKESKKASEEMAKSCRVINNGKFSILKDSSSECYNISNGIRKTKGVTLDFSNKIYFHGPCIVRGGAVSDNYTIPSYVQNEISLNKSKYACVNCGVSGRNDQINDFEYMLHDRYYERGDIVIHINRVNPILKKVMNKHKSNYYETSHIFNRPHNYGRWLVDKGFHMNHIANKAISKYIYNVIRKNLYNNSHSKNSSTYKFEKDIDNILENDCEFASYINELKKLKTSKNISGKIGAIRVTANPFTLGHRYLIEQALKQVDHLYIMVIEIDSFEFPFKDRLELVKKGVEDLGDKVTVIPSGKWRSVTFLEYINKEHSQKTLVDPSKTVLLLAKYVSPALGVTKHFGGSEPNDTVTLQFHESRKKLFPKYGIEFEIIPRKELDELGVISASKVRAALKNKDFRTIKKHVPESTYNYLLDKFS